jgi:hypothetical protein
MPRDHKQQNGSTWQKKADWQCIPRPCSQLTSQNTGIAKPVTFGFLIGGIQVEFVSINCSGQRRV